MSEPSSIRRYTNLTHEIVLTKTTNIIELGISNGINAERMIPEAIHYNAAYPAVISYFGFDLFEENIEQIVGESVPVPGPYSRPLTILAIREKLRKTGAEINLYGGSTFDTLPDFVERHEHEEFNFIFIDAGHSFEAQRNDWKYVQQLMNKDTVVLIDDYLEGGHIEGGKDWGVNAAVQLIDRRKYNVEILEPKDILPLPEDTTCMEPYISYDPENPATNAIVKVTRRLRC